MHEAVVRDIIKWIILNQGRDLSLKQISGVSGYSSGYLQRIFYEQCHCTIGSFCRRYKLVSIIDELRENVYPLKTLGINYGYSTQQAFSHYFMRETGCTLGQCRKSTECNQCRITHMNFRQQCFLDLF